MEMYPTLPAGIKLKHQLDARKNQLMEYLTVTRNKVRAAAVAVQLELFPQLIDIHPSNGTKYTNVITRIDNIQKYCEKLLNAHEIVGGLTVGVRRSER